MPFFIMLLWLFLQGQAWASPQKIAVLDLLMTPKDSTQKALIEDEIRAILFQFSRPDEINILTRERTKLLLEKKEKTFRCLSFSCMNDLARSIDTDFVIFGSVEQQNKRWELDIRLFDRKKNRVVATADSHAPDTMTLIQNLASDLEDLMRKLPVERPPKKEKIQSKEPATQSPLKNQKNQQNLRFHLLSFQCAKNKFGFNFLGYCHSGVFLGPVHLGALVYSNVEGMFLGGIQTSIYNETDSFLGALQLGIVNNTKTLHFGIQMAVANDARQLYGLQLGIVNQVDDLYGFQLGVVNDSKDTYGVQAGLINNSKRIYGAQIGFINVTQYLYGIQLGFLNFSKNNAAPISVGINIGW